MPLHPPMYIHDTSNKYNYEKSLFCSIVSVSYTHLTPEENTASEPMPQAAVTVTAGTAQVVLKVDQKGAAIPPPSYRLSHTDRRN